MLQVLDSEAVLRWAGAAVATLDAHCAEIDELNVFPVPDGDTGTNLLLTLRAGAEAVTKQLDADRATTAGAALTEFARASALAARGNSGVIISQVLAGVAEGAASAPTCDAALLRGGLALGADQAYAAVAEPVEGTILSVARAVAEATGTPGPSGSLAELVDGAVRAAEEALGRTTAQLPVLAEAGVVDAGGLGLVLLLAALRHVVTGAPVPEPVAGASSRDRRVHAGTGDYGYEVQFVLDASERAASELRTRLTGLGNSVVVAAAGAMTWSVHAHVADAGAAIEAALALGRPRDITVGFLDGQLSARHPGEHPPEPIMPGIATGAGATTVVAVAPGAGLADLFAAEGVLVVVGGPGGVPGVDSVVAVVRQADQVILLPNAADVLAIATEAAERARAQGVRVTVVPTRSPVQGLAAVAVHDAQRRFDDDAVAMAEAAAATRFAEITVARHQSLTSIGICQEGDILGLIDGEVVEIGRGLVAVALALVDRLLGVGAELMTILVGVDAPAGMGELLTRHVRGRSPLTEVNVYAGGQPDYPVIIGVE